MAATLKTLLEKTTAAHKAITSEDSIVDGAYQATQAKLEALRKSRDSINEQIDVLEDVQYALECRDEYDVTEALERLKKIA